jgi:hypothetical protein
VLLLQSLFKSVGIGEHQIYPEGRAPVCAGRARSTSDSRQIFIEAGTYEGTVHKLNNICTFLPIIFDEFGGFTINGVYQSTILEYRFESTGEIGEFSNFLHYLQAATNGCISPINSVEKQSLK